MNGARDQVFADAAFARQQHRSARRRHAHHRSENLLHRRAAADDVVPAVLAAEFLFKLAVLVAQIADFERLADDGYQMIERKRLQQEIDGAGLHRLDRVLDRAERGHHDHRDMRIHAADDLEHLEAGHSGQLEIGEDQVGAIDQRQRFFGGRGLLDIETGVEQLQFQDAAQLVFVFYNQNSFFHIFRILRRRRLR